MVTKSEYDLIVIGGGINGAALARLASHQGLKVGLFEAGDFGQGASTATSKLIHGGLRYLENFDFSLVRGSVRERLNLLHTAPHLVEEKRFLFPNTRLGRHFRPAIKMGMILYDFMAGRQALKPHTWLNALKLHKTEPAFLPEENCGAYAYSDCVMDDARLVLENILDAQQLGAEVFNYHRFIGVERLAERASKNQSKAKIIRNLEVTVLDRLSQKEKVLHCDNIAFTLGPWTDKIIEKKFTGQTAQLRLSQGIHLLVDKLDSQNCFILPIPQSKRYFFVVPWKYGHLIGTTETELKEALEEPKALESEITDLINWTKTYFPKENLQPICTITGIRPLARAKGLGTSALSREQVFHKMEEHVFSAVGGKYTTHRQFAEGYFQFMFPEKAMQSLQNKIFPGGWKNAETKDRLEKTLAKFSFLDISLITLWLRRYGARAVELTEFIMQKPEYQNYLAEKEQLLAGEVYFSIHKEFARCPLDFYRRRTDLFFTRSGGMASLVAVEQIFQKEVPGYTGQMDLSYTAYLKRNNHCASI